LLAQRLNRRVSSIGLLRVSQGTHGFIEEATIAQKHDEAVTAVRSIGKPEQWRKKSSGGPPKIPDDPVDLHRFNVHREGGCSDKPHLNCSPAVAQPRSSPRCGIGCAELQSSTTAHVQVNRRYCQV